MKFLVLALLLFGSISQAANRYVRAGAVGNGSGSDWVNAYSTLPATLVRGDIYYVADGIYGSVTMDDPVSGSIAITIKKATLVDHGTAVGWLDTYGDGQAQWVSFDFSTSYYVIDGQARNENNWQDTPSYGFRVIEGFYSNAYNNLNRQCADNITVRFSDIGGPNSSSFLATTGEAGIYNLGSSTDICNGWVIQSSHIHNVIIPMQIAGGNGHLIEKNFIGPSWGKEAIRGQNQSSNIIIRYNYFKDACQYTPGDSTSGCTAEIAMWGENTAGAFSGNEIYGNIFQKTTTEPNSGGVIVVGGDGNGWVGSSASNTKVFNNTIVGLKAYNSQILVNGGSGNIVMNNIWYDSAGRITGCSANTCTNNVIYTTSPFVNYPTNLKLAKATATGSVLLMPYNLDMTGAIRGSDGVWDLGAYEFGATMVEPQQKGKTLKSTPTTINVK